MTSLSQEERNGAVRLPLIYSARPVLIVKVCAYIQILTFPFSKDRAKENHTSEHLLEPLQRL